MTELFGKRPVAAALSYKKGDAGAPRVMATGRGALAERILALAFENGVKVREDADLAELLSSVDVGCEIPTEALIAVAEIIAYLYRLNGQMKEGPGWSQSN
jgi:flagellar biosynthesis protein